MILKRECFGRPLSSLSFISPNSPSYMEWNSVPTKASGDIRIENCVPACNTIMLWGETPKKLDECTMYAFSIFVMVNAA